MHEPQAGQATRPGQVRAPDVPLVSVVLATMDDDDRVAETVWSVLNQSLAGIELIAVDRGSSDDTPRILAAAASDPRVTVLEAAGASRGAALDLGVARARGTYLMFADADGTLPEHACASVVARARETAAELVVGGHVRFEPRRLTTHPAPAPGTGRALWNRLIDRSAWHAAGLTCDGGASSDDDGALAALRTDRALRRVTTDDGACAVQIRRARVGEPRRAREARAANYVAAELACLAELRADPGLLDRWAGEVLRTGLWPHLPALLGPEALADAGLGAAREGAARIVRAAPASVWRGLPADRLRGYVPLLHRRWSVAASALRPRRPATPAGRLGARVTTAGLSALGAAEALLRGLAGAGR
ncbi:glycosyltransferase family 2 protein [Myceligenerans crystallogenes]|uniref:Glycosyltransferase 2-like domain-containing protein n=1 Tax=Myceligenerans crystallogenes TaxID=316335 RepID=A0ABN2NBW5_9MICO